MEAPISPNDSIIAGFLPMRSAMRPITMPPSGRVRKPTPKVASDFSKPMPGVAEGKKAWPMCTAKKA